LFDLARTLSPHLPGSQGGIGFAFDVALSALLVGPPAVLMGATIPFLTQALAKSLDDATRIHALVYASNTAGAFAGALAAGFWLRPLPAPAAAPAPMPALTPPPGSPSAPLARRARAEGLGVAAPRPAPTTREGPPGFAAYLAVALLTGFAMITLQ